MLHLCRCKTICSALFFQFSALVKLSENIKWVLVSHGARFFPCSCAHFFTHTLYCVLYIFPRKFESISTFFFFIFPIVTCAFYACSHAIVIILSVKFSHLRRYHSSNLCRNVEGDKQIPSLVRLFLLFCVCSVLLC